MFFSQPLSTRFGTLLISHIESGRWSRIDIAVAWVRASGIQHLKSALEGFLSKGGKLRLVAGVDFDNTTKEGLEALLALMPLGAVEIFIHHNEASTVFHPKLYLFTSETDGKLIVGSNNLTEAGLFLNTEAGIELDVLRSDAAVQSALDAMDAWCDTSSGLALPLSATLIQELVDNNYIMSETEVRALQSTRKSKNQSRKKKLFKSLPVTPPTPAAKPKVAANSITKTAKSLPHKAATPIGQVLLMRIRKASEKDRPTQTQIPKVVAESTFFGGVTTVRSTHDGEYHQVHEARARGKFNTLKLEIPEMRHIQDPVIRFERTPSGIQYAVYDAKSSQGKSIMNALRAGLVSQPWTELTRPSTPESSTWWRFI